MTLNLLKTIIEGNFKNHLIESYDEENKIVTLIDGVTGCMVKKVLDDLPEKYEFITCTSFYPFLSNLRILDVDINGYSEGKYIKYVLVHSLGIVKALFSQAVKP